jgi:hypothetical protein
MENGYAARAAQVWGAISFQIRISPTTLSTAFMASRRVCHSSGLLLNVRQMPAHNTVQVPSVRSTTTAAISPRWDSASGRCRSLRYVVAGRDFNWELVIYELSACFAFPLIKRGARRQQKRSQREQAPPNSPPPVTSVVSDSA